MRPFRVLLAFTALATLAGAHVGSPDIYLDGKAGPYQLFITVRTPAVIPGVAELEIRSESPGISDLRAVPLPMSGPGATFAPVPDKLKRSPQDPQLFTGSLWMMTTGSWQVKLTASGAQGAGVLAVPVPSKAVSIEKMQFGLGALLSLLGFFLIGGVVAMAGASVREARLAPGVNPDAAHRRGGRIAMAITFCVVIAVVALGRAWWNSEAESYSQHVYKPLQMSPSLDGSILTLNLSEPGWMQPIPGRLRLFIRKVDDFVPDHDHLMHLYAIRQPGLDVVYHLHPDLVDTGVFRLALPSMPGGSYKLYADVVHANGFPETLVGSVSMPELRGRALSGDDAAGFALPWQRAAGTTNVFHLPDGYTMEWLRPAKALRPKQPVLFRFRLTDRSGAPPSDMALYMGMPGHAAFVKTDGTVFAHIHPAGSVSMAAFDLAQKQVGSSTTAPRDMNGMNMAGMQNDLATLPNEVSFPYGFPSPGRYRIFVQMKHGETVETGIFDADVPN